MIYSELALWFFVASCVCTALWMIAGWHVSKHRHDTEQFEHDCDDRSVERRMREW